MQQNRLTFSPVPPFEDLKYIAGVDISFVKNTNKACAFLDILSYPDLKIVWETHDIVEMTEEYVPFYLAFREVRHLVKLFERCQREKGEMYPQVVLVDGGGVWHPKGTHPLSAAEDDMRCMWTDLMVGLGLASHLGVLLGIPTIGIAKSLLYLPDIPQTITYDTLRASFTPDPSSPTSTSTNHVLVRGESGTVYGAAVIPRNAKSCEKPIFVSVGHLLSLDTAVELVHATSLFRVPEAIRGADQGGREVLRKLEERAKKDGKGILEVL